MGTLSKALNLTKRLFNGQKNKANKSEYSTRNMRRHGEQNKVEEKYRYGGGRSSVNSSDACIYFPKRKKFKGYLKDAS